MLLLCIRQSKNILVTPQFLFIIGFILEVFYSFSYVDMYDIHLKGDTMLVLVLGMVVFVVISNIISNHYKKKWMANNEYGLQTKDVLCNAEPLKYVLCIVISIVAILLTIRFLLSINSSSVLKAMYSYRAEVLGYSSAKGIKMSVPFLVRIFRRFCIASGYFFSYILAYQIVNKKKKYRILTIANIVLSIICDSLLGGRKGAIGIVFSFLIMYYIMSGNKIKWKHKTKYKKIVVVILVAFSFLSVFSLTAQMVGRKVSSSNKDYLSDYLAAPMKNLDIFVSQDNMGADDSFCLSLTGYAELVTNYLKIDKLNQGQGYHYNIVNGENIGNAYTTYYAFLHDFGYWGVVLFIGLMSLISQIVFSKALRANPNDISISVIVYGFISYGVFLSFFDNTFYNELVKVQFVEYLIVWYFLKMFFIMPIKSKNRSSNNLLRC